MSGSVFFPYHNSNPLMSWFVFFPVQSLFDQYSLVVQFEIREHDTSSIVLFYQNCLGYSESFAFPYNSRVLYSNSMKHAIGILTEITLTLQIALRSMVIFTVIISILIHKHCISVCLCHLRFLSTCLTVIQVLVPVCPTCHTPWVASPVDLSTH